MKPIENFGNQETLDNSLKEWKERLFLSDWIIKAKIVPEKEWTKENVAAYYEAVVIHNSAIIYIKEYNEEEQFIKKMPHELRLVHELLHLKFPEISEYENTNDICINKYHRDLHQLLEQMAVALILSKYNLSKDWFDNIDDKQQNTNNEVLDIIKNKSFVLVSNRYIEEFHNSNIDKLLKFVQDEYGYNTNNTIFIVAHDNYGSISHKYCNNIVIIPSDYKFNRSIDDIYISIKIHVIATNQFMYITEESLIQLLEKYYF